MRAGQLDRRITIEQNTPGQDTYGAPIESWSTLATVWAGVAVQSGREFLADEARLAERVIAERKTVFTIRWRPDVTTLMQVRYGGDLYNINATKEISRKAGLELHTTAIRVE